MEDFYRMIDAIIVPRVEIVFLASVSLIAFISMLGILYSKNTSRSPITETSSRSSHKIRKVVMILFLVLLAEALTGLSKAVISYRTTIEYIITWIVYYIYVVILTRLVNSGDLPKKPISVLLPSLIVLTLSINNVNPGIAITEDTLDILQILRNGRLETSFHAVHYDVAPLHTFTYVILSDVLGSKPLDTTPFVLMGISLGWAFLLYLYNAVKQLQNSKTGNSWILLLLPFLLFVHPYSFGGLLTSYVNSFSYTPILILLLNVLLKFRLRGYPMSGRDLALAFILITASILMHPMGFTILASSILALLFAIHAETSSGNMKAINDSNNIKVYLRYITAFATTLFVIKALYTGLRYGLETFLSYVLEALFAAPHRGISELTPRTYHKAPISSLYSYSFALGLISALFLHHFMAILRRRAKWIEMFNTTIYALTLLLAALSVPVVSQRIPSKYIIGTLMPSIPICLALDLMQLSSGKTLASYSKRFLVISIIFIASFGTLTSPLILFSHYRFVQGANPASDLDYIVATQIASMISPNSYIKCKVVYDPQWPYNTPAAIQTVLGVQRLLGHKMILVDLHFDTLLDRSYSLVYSGFNAALEVIA